MVFVQLILLCFSSFEESVSNLQQLTTQVPDMFQSVLTNTGEIRYKLHTYFQRRIDDRELIKMWKVEKGCPEPERW